MLIRGVFIPVLPSKRKGNSGTPVSGTLLVIPGVSPEGINAAPENATMLFFKNFRRPLFSIVLIFKMIYYTVSPERVLRYQNQIQFKTI